MDRKVPQAAVPVQPGATNMADIRGIKGPVTIPNSYAWLGWVLAGALVLAAVWWMWKKLRRRNNAPKPVPVIPPHRKAKDRLRAAEELLSDPYAFCFLVSGVVRTYIEERFDLQAPERTTEEFLDELRRSTELRRDHKSLLEAFLEQCDLVKFARFEPTQLELRNLLEAALRFIDETAPVPGSEEAPQLAAEAASGRNA